MIYCTHTKFRVEMTGAFLLLVYSIGIINIYCDLVYVFNMQIIPVLYGSVSL